MNGRLVALACALLSASCRGTAESEPPHAFVRAGSAKPAAIAPPTSARTDAPDATASPASTPRAGAAVTPTVRLTKLDDTYDGRANEGWPVFEYLGLPALSADGAKLAVVEERDGYGHTPAPGVRVVETATGRSLQFLALVPAGKGPEALAALAQLDAVFRARIDATNEALAKVKWESLAEVGAEKASDRDGWSVDGLAIALEWAAAEPGELKKVTIRDEAAGRVLVEQDTAPWRRTAVRCASPNLRLIGASRAKKLVAFSQRLGATLHDCDNVAIPTEYRVLRLP